MSGRCAVVSWGAAAVDVNIRRAPVGRAVTTIHRATPTRAAICMEQQRLVSVPPKGKRPSERHTSGTPVAVPPTLPGSVCREVWEMMTVTRWAEEAHGKAQPLPLDRAQ